MRTPFSDVKIISHRREIAWCGELELSYVEDMEEKILKLIENYKSREAFLTSVIVDLQKHRPPTKAQLDELNSAKNTRALWRVVVKDLEGIIR